MHHKLSQLCGDKLHFFYTQICFNLRAAFKARQGNCTQPFPHSQTRTCRDGLEFRFLSSLIVQYWTFIAAWHKNRTLLATGYRATGIARTCQSQKFNRKYSKSGTINGSCHYVMLYSIQRKTFFSSTFPLKAQFQSRARSAICYTLFWK